jgi:hypothetical protein
MIYPVLAYKKNGDLKLYGFAKESEIKNTSKELLRAGVFNGVFIVDSAGNEYSMKNVREVGTRGFWGINLMRKGRQIIVDFDLVIVSQRTVSDLKDFVLGRIDSRKQDSLTVEIYENVNKAISIEQIISCFV